MELPVPSSRSEPLTLPVPATNADVVNAVCQEERSDGEEDIHLQPHEAERFHSSQIGLLRVIIDNMLMVCIIQ